MTNQAKKNPNDAATAKRRFDKRAAERAKLKQDKEAAKAKMKAALDKLKNT